MDFPSPQLNQISTFIILHNLPPLLSPVIPFKFGSITFNHSSLLLLCITGRLQCCLSLLCLTLDRPLAEAPKLSKKLKATAHLQCLSVFRDKSYYYYCHDGVRQHLPFSSTPKDVIMRLPREGLGETWIL